MSDRRYLQLQTTKGLGPKTLTRLLLQLQRRSETVEDFFRASPAAWRSEYGLADKIVDALQAGHDQVDETLAALAAQDIRLVAIDQPAYPRRLITFLGEDAPPLLFLQGNSALLERPGVGFGGARDVSEQGLRAAADIASQLAGAGANVISGHARGTDMEAHKAALLAGGVTTLVLAEGILTFSLRPELRLNDVWDRVLVVFQFAPRLPWSVGNAMARNGTIIGLAQAMVIVEAGLSGGTFAAGEQAMRLRKPLFVVAFAQPAPVRPATPTLSNAAPRRSAAAKSRDGRMSSLFCRQCARRQRNESLPTTGSTRNSQPCSFSWPSAATPSSQPINCQTRVYPRTRWFQRKPP